MNDIYVVRDTKVKKVKDSGVAGDAKSIALKAAEDEKAQIYAWLVEAREFALDAENSNKKHAAFGKYKGRINNYLAKRGELLYKDFKN